MCYTGPVEVPDGTTAIPPYHDFQAPPEQEGHHAVMTYLGWTLVEGPTPPLPPYNPAEVQAQNKAQASSLLSQTDWTAIPSVADPAQSNPYLVNQDEFLSYRSQVRQIAVNPPDAPIDQWPVMPDEVWASV